MSDLATTHVRKAARVGAIAGGVVFTWMLTRGTFDLLRHQNSGDFFDAQAHAFLHGHLDVDPQLLKIEAFFHSGRAYLYFGPFPALLRLPFAVFTHRLDGRLSILSMLGAYIVAMAALIHIADDVHRRVAPTRTLTRRGRIGIAGLFAVLGGGSSLLFLASVAWVYHEAAAWGVAWSLVALAALVRVVEGAGRRALVVSAAATLLALWSRASVALGPVAGLVAVAVWSTVSRSRRRDVGAVWPAALVPIVGYAVVNHAKFGRWFSIPFRDQAFTAIDPDRQAMLAANHGTLFGLKFAPTTAFAYLRPDGVRLRRWFPFVDFPPAPGRVFGHVILDKFDLSSSVTASLTLLVVLTAVAVVGLTRAQTPLSAYRLVLGASAAGAVAVIPFAYVAQRYLADAFPLLAIGAIVGLFTVAPVTSHRRAVGVAVVALALWTAWANFSLSLLYQRLSTPAREQRQLTGFLGFQRSVDKLLSLDDPARVVRGDLLPAQGRRGELFVVGDCTALYYSDGHPPSTLEPIAWTPVERTDAVGYLTLDVTFAAPAAGVVEPLVTVAEPAGAEPDVIAVEYLGSGRARLVYRGRGVPLDGSSFAIRAGRVHHLTVDADRRLGTVQVRDGSAVVFGTFYNAGTDEFSLATAPRFSGTINRRPANDAVLCRRLDAWTGGDA
jgi:hypothetical protein